MKLCHDRIQQSRRLDELLLPDEFAELEHGLPLIHKRRAGGAEESPDRSWVIHIENFSDIVKLAEDHDSKEAAEVQGRLRASIYQETDRAND